MARDLTALEICERALRMIGMFPLSDSAPDAEQVREALLWLDIDLGEEAGTQRLFHFIEEGVNLTLEAGTREYPLRSSLGASYPIEGIQHPVGAWLIGANGERKHLEIVKRDTWRGVSNDLRAGTPEWIFIDRYPNPTLWTWPSLPATATGTYRIQLDVQRRSPNVAPGGVSGTRASGAGLHGFREEWQRYLIYKLAQDLGSGPIVKLAEGSIARFERVADKAKKKLDAFANREHDTEPPIARAYDDYGYDNHSPWGGISGATTPTTPTPPTDPGVPPPETPTSGSFSSDFNADFS